MAKSATIDLSSLGTIGGKKSSGPKTKTTDFIETKGLADRVALSVIAKEIESHQKGLIGNQVTDQIIDHFIVEGTVLGRCPPNYHGIDNGTKASLQLRRKDDRSALKPEQIDLCVEHGITVKHHVVRDGTFAVNPKYASDETRVVKMLELLQKAGFPTDYIVRQEEEAREVVGDEALDDIFAAAKKAGPNSNSLSPATIRELLTACAIPMVGRSDWSDGLPEALEIATKILCPPPEVVKAKVAEQFTAAAEVDVDAKKTVSKRRA